MQRTEHRAASARTGIFLAIGLTTLAAGLLAACGGGGSSAPPLATLLQATAVLGQPDFISFEANAGSVTSATGLAQPQGGIATDGQKFYVADSGNNRILGWLSIPKDDTVAPDFVLGQAGFTGDKPGTTATTLAGPSAVTISGTYLVVTDSGNNRVLIWNSLPTSNTAPDVIVGQPDAVHNDPATTQNGLSYPADASIAAGKLFVVDQGNHRVLIWNTVPTTSNQAAADVVLGQADFTSAIEGDETTGLTNPTAVWTDGYHLLVSDSGNNRVMYWLQVPRTNAAPASYALGQVDFAHFSSGTSGQQLFTPYGISSDGVRVYIADSNNNRVLKFDSFPIASGQEATEVFGQSTFGRRTANDDNQDGTQDANPSARTLSSPTGVFLYQNNLYVTDRSNHRVLVFAE